MRDKPLYRYASGLDRRDDALEIGVRRVFFFKQKTAYDITVRDWSSDVCSSDLTQPVAMSRRNDCCSESAMALAVRSQLDGRSEERRVGKECGLLCRSRWSPS